MTDNPLQEQPLAETPGTLLKRAREAQELGERETADRLNWRPDYVAIIERDDYQALRNPVFARGYIKAYGKLLGLDETELMVALARVESGAEPESKQDPAGGRPMPLQQTGVGIITGLGAMALLILVLWWYRGPDYEVEQAETATPESALQITEESVGQ